MSSSPRQRLLIVLALALVVVTLSSPVQAAKPNILFLFADDQRPDTIHALGNDQIRTPNLDRLVHDGVAFSQAHIMGGLQGAVCVPSRAMLMSGRSLFRVNEKLNRETLMPAHFANEGYATFGTGKWHNGGASFVRAFGNGDNVFLGGMSDQFKIKTHPLAALTKGDQGQARTGEKHASELFADGAIDFLKQKRDQPFFCYVAFTAPHDPRQSPPEYAQMYDPSKLSLPANYMPVHPWNNGEMKVRDEQLAPWPRTETEVRRHLADYYGIISHMDAQIGRILNTLKEVGQLENTIIVFSADNGLAIGSHGLFGKQNLYEHSMGVPLVISGPGLNRDRRTKAMTYSFDIFPTLCELAGIDVPSDVEGQSYAPVLRGERDKHRETLMFAYRHVQRAVRDDRYKLIRYPQINKSQLFDLEQDPFELTDLSYVPDHGERVGDLTRLLEKSQAQWGDNLSLFTNEPQPLRYTAEELSRKR
jgi:arylsulfatase A-like enzyme